MNIENIIENIGGCPYILYNIVPIFYIHTVLEKLPEDISFEAPEKKNGKLLIDREYVRNKLSEIVKDEDLSRYIL